MILIILVRFSLAAQNLPAGFPLLEEAQRRQQLSQMDSLGNSFVLRPLLAYQNYGKLQISDTVERKAFEWKLLPVLQSIRFNSQRPYGWGDYGMIPNVGWQSYSTAGFFAKWKFISLQLSPEFHAAENRAFQGYQGNLGPFAHQQSFLLRNYGDYPERFGDQAQREFLWGQSKLALGFWAFEMGVSTQSLWWGPGQWSALTFSNNAQGFPYLTLNTRRPAKTFLGNFEGQLISGRIDESGLAPTQNQALNERYFVPFTGDWKYLNAIAVSYNPKWIPGLFVGLSRTAQIYRQNMSVNFGDLFPVFEGLTKQQFFDENNTTVDFDSDGRDQQMTAFFRWVIPKFNFEFYTEFGRRDHPLNWREFSLNPEHARAYLMGFKKLVQLGKEATFLQVRGEVLQQQESINRIIRYGPSGGITWHTHTPSRGFAQKGQALGAGIGLGSNVQIFEVARISHLNKLGVIFERLENNQAFFYRTYFAGSEHQPWVDLSMALLIDHQWNNLLISSRLKHIHARNYQWQFDPKSDPLCPVGFHMNSFHGQISLIYLMR